MNKAKKILLKKAAAMGLSLLMLAGVLSGCGDGGQSVTNDRTQTENSQSADSQAVNDQEGNSRESGQNADSQAESSAASDAAAAASQSSDQAAASSQSSDQAAAASQSSDQAASSQSSDRAAATIRVGSLKGPTSLGLLNLMDRSSRGETADNYEFQMATGADELLPLMVKGDLDIVLVPANVAAVLYQKTDGGVEVIDINTLGVLYMVTGTADVSSVADLKGKTVYLTGKGTTPEASLRYLLDASGLKEEDVTLEFKSEAAEVAAVLAENPDAIGLLPQPFVTAACIQNDSLKIVLDINEEWLRVQGEAGNSSGMVTGVTVVRKEFLNENPEAVTAFLEEHAASAEAVNEDPAAGAALAVEAGIVAKEPIARKAIPQCNIVCITGKEMKEALSGYLNVLNEFNAELVGGAIPEDDFYYIP